MILTKRMRDQKHVKSLDCLRTEHLRSLLNFLLSLFEILSNRFMKIGIWPKLLSTATRFPIITPNLTNQFGVEMAGSFFTIAVTPNHDGWSRTCVFQPLIRFHLELIKFYPHITRSARCPASKRDVFSSESLPFSSVPVSRSSQHFMCK